MGKAHRRSFSVTLTLCRVASTLFINCLQTTWIPTQWPTVGPITECGPRPGGEEEEEQSVGLNEWPREWLPSDDSSRTRNCTTPRWRWAGYATELVSLSRIVAVGGGDLQSPNLAPWLKSLAFNFGCPPALDSNAVQPLVKNQSPVARIAFIT